MTDTEVPATRSGKKNIKIDDDEELQDDDLQGVLDWLQEFKK